MRARLAHIFRHPVKSHGGEELGRVTLGPGQCLPWDRHWAVTHEKSTWNAATPGWLPCVNFLIGSGNARIMAINAVLDERGPSLTLTHPDLPPLVFNPDLAADQARFLAWIAPLVPEGRSATGLVSAPGRGMTDADYPSVSLCNLASDADLAGKMQATLSPLRWRGNLWVEGWAPWAEAGLVGQSLRIGEVTLHVREPIRRCKATTANPETGIADVDTLAGLRAHTGAQDFGIYAEVTQGGTVHVGDDVEVLA